MRRVNLCANRVRVRAKEVQVHGSVCGVFSVFILSDLLVFDGSAGFIRSAGLHVSRDTTLTVKQGELLVKRARKVVQ